MAKVNVNERSWAIDLISEINKKVSQKKIAISHAGGESTLKNSSGSLFPDVLLFGDPKKGDILQGWELKMPDTSITDSEFFGNAKKKAELLKLNSFLLWNVSEAVLYNFDGAEYVPLKAWPQLTKIKTRKDVETFSDEWKKLLDEILNDLNEFFISGKLNNKHLIENISLDEFIDVILENTDQVSSKIASATSKNRVLGAQVNSWWASSKSEYNDEVTQNDVLARLVLTDWLIKFVFAHIIKKNFNAAREIENIDFAKSIEEGCKSFENISKTCDFWNIFSSNLGQDLLTDKAWDQLIQINLFLCEINISSIDINILHGILQNSILKARRKVAGQYSTPQKLAEFLVKITVEDTTENIIDPCCGTGTIIKEAYKLKEDAGISQNEIAKNIWASDKYSFPIQLATLALSKPDNFGLILRIFRKDVIDLAVKDKIEFINPNSGKKEVEVFPEVKYIVSNLPFVQQEDVLVLNPEIEKINEFLRKSLKENVALDGRSDLYVYIPFYLYRILKNNGKLGLILSNAWLGTDYGKSFISILRKLFVIESVVVSGKGKWFDNADVVTTILVLKKTNNIGAAETKTRFCTLHENINKIDIIDLVSDSVLLGKGRAEVGINEYSAKDIEEFEKLKLPWSALFADLSWLTNMKSILLPVKDVFTIGRGERRGWNPMFYPEAGNKIEKKFLKPVLKNLRDCKGLVASPNKSAFCCSLTKSELKTKGYNGALSWINTFEKLKNEKGKPLPQVLVRPNHEWYEMKTDTLADFAANINYDKSLFIAKLSERSFVDQRIIALITNKKYRDEDPVLLLAILNSSLSMFFIEALGFGRGLGALDLSAGKFAEGFRLMDPGTLNAKAKSNIVKAFTPLMKRDRLPLLAELKAKDRIDFEDTFFKEFKIGNYQKSVHDALKQLFTIRFSVNA